MKLGTKIVLAGVLSVTAATIVALIVQRAVIFDQGVALTKTTMRAAVIQAEAIRENISHFQTNDAFNREHLLAEYKKAQNYQDTTLYRTIPVVAAWESIAKVAKEENFNFRVPKFQPRNPDNTPTTEEAAILKHFEQTKAKELFEIKDGMMIYAKPIYLSRDCLACHGDPATSPTGDGKDILGFDMENWKVGDLSGAFILRADVQRVENVATHGTREVASWMVPLAILIAILLIFASTRIVVQPLNNAVDKIRNACDETASISSYIDTASQSLAQGATQQAASLEETSASVEEMSSLTKSNAEQASKAADAARDTLKAAEEGVRETEQMTQAMGDIREAADNIAQIIKTIDEIAFQTNILALNAAVEAARAGEAGQGFAVVADEVRALAQRAAQAARETGSRIETSIQRSVHGVEISGKVSLQLEQIVARARSVDEFMASIAKASQEQAIGFQQISSAIGDMDTTVQSAAASTEETAGSCSQLNEQAESLREAVQEIVNLMEGIHD